MRILFSNGKQKKFLSDAAEKLNINLKELYSKLSPMFSISFESFKNYYKEYRTLPLNIADYISKLSGINWKIYQVMKLLPDNWGKIKGGKLGARSLLKKYTNQIKKWRIKGGQNSTKYFIKNAKKIITPPLSERLAEFIGIILGDGTLTKNFVRISTDSRYDMQYLNYVNNLCKDLFGISGKIKKDPYRNVANLKIFSVNLCKFVNIKFGLPFGDKIKNKAQIPRSIVLNKRSIKGCLRGLIDTDGSVSRYSGGSLALYFTSHNKLLLQQVYKAGNKLSVFNYSGTTICGTVSMPKISKYFRLIGSSNLRHIIRFDKKVKENKLLYLNEVLKFYRGYQNIRLPFKWGSVV